MAGRRTRNRGRIEPSGTLAAHSKIQSVPGQVSGAPVIGAEPVSRPANPIPGGSGVIATDARRARGAGSCGMCGRPVWAGQRIADVAGAGPCHVAPCITGAAGS
jgi:hypothetical protein